jgi:Na+/H+ antiporter NhaD/arsenite permease-like protein
MEAVDAPAPEHESGDDGTQRTGTPPVEPGEVDGYGGRAGMAFIPRLCVWVVTLALVGRGTLDRYPTVELMLVALAGVVTIVTDSRFRWERRLEHAGLPSREAWVPLLMLAVMWRFQMISAANVWHVAEDDGPVIAFILAFAVVAICLRRSGYIHFLAFRLSEKGGGNTTRLTLYLFMLSSLLTYVTSNDIVVLTMTPIVISVATQARMRNAKLLLLSQFVAANTVSMGLLIGSPTNLIVGRALDIDFLTYFFLMLVPSVIALMATFIFVTWVNNRVERQGFVSRLLPGSWAFDSSYVPPRFSKHRARTERMRRARRVFLLAVALLIAGTSVDYGLLVAAVLIAVVGGGALWLDAQDARLAQEGKEGKDPWEERHGNPLKEIPWGIIFFGLAYFVISDAVAATPFVREEVTPHVAEMASSHTPVASWGSIVSTGVLVNMINDLPAAALSGEVLQAVDESAHHRESGWWLDAPARHPRVGMPLSDEAYTPFDRVLIVQGVLVGLNIATYVTPVGALAGIIWFKTMHTERAAQRREEQARAAATAATPLVDLPRRTDLLAYGTLTFVTMAAVLGAVNFATVSVGDFLLGPPQGRTTFGSGGAGHFWSSVACGSVVVAVMVGFRVALNRAGVALTHLRDLLSAVTVARIWAARHRVVVASGATFVIFVGSGRFLQWAELFHRTHYKVPKEESLDGALNFMTWFVVFVASGSEDRDLFPHSVVGKSLVALLALGSIGALLLIFRLSTSSNEIALGRRLGTGEIPNDRLVVVNPAADDEAALRTLIAVAGSQRFVTIATREHDLAGMLQLRNDKGVVIPYARGGASLVADLRLDQAREIVLLSRSIADDFDNLALLATLEEALLPVPGVGARGELPVVVLQAHGEELGQLVKSRLRGGRVPPQDTLRNAMAWPPFEPVLRRLLVAEAAGAIDRVASMYEAPLAARRPWGDDRDSDGDMVFDEPSFTLAVRPAASPLDTGDPWPTRGDSAEVGVQVEIAGMDDWRTHAVDRSDELGRRTNGRVVIAPPTPGAPVGGDGAGPDGRGDGSRGEGNGGPRRRTTVYVMGSGGLAQRCAIDLLRAGVGRVVLQVPRDEVLLPEVENSGRYEPTDRHLILAGADAGSSDGAAGDGAGGDGDDAARAGGIEGLEVSRFAEERVAADVLMERPGPHDAILVIDTEDGANVVSEKTLERLSLARVRRSAAGEPVPAFFLCCRGAGRADRLRNFVVDEVIDATSVEASYLTAFATVYFEVLPGFQAIAHSDVGRRVRLAHGIASRLCHLDVWRPADVRFVKDGTTQEARDLAPDEIVELDRTYPSRRGPLVGVVEFPPSDSDRDEEVRVRVDIPVAELPVAPPLFEDGGIRLVVGIPYL